MLRLPTFTSLGLLLLSACGGGGGTTDGATDSTAGASSSGSSPSSTGAGTTAPTTSSASDVTTTVADTGGLTTGTGTSGDTGDTGDTGDLPDGACRDSADCLDRSESCFAPGEQNCGDCQTPDSPCLDDAGCDAGFVCLPFEAPCACNLGERGCVPVCEPDGCGPEASCNVETGACEPFKCADDDTLCPLHFDCVPGSGGDDCVRRPCSADADCGGTPCVEGGCHEAFGVCMPAVP